MILVTGGAGYIGTALVRMLTAMETPVRVVDKLYFGREPLDGVGKIDLVQKDFRALESRDLKGVTDVIHLAGLSNDPTAEWRPDKNEEVNAQGTGVFAEQCAAHGVRKFLFASTASIYDAGGTDPQLSEEHHEVAPTAAYAVSKYRAEQAILALATRYPEFCPVVLRKGTVYGWSSRMRFDLVINQMVYDAMTKGTITVTGGHVWRPLLSVTDAARAYVMTVMSRPEIVRAKVYNVAEGNYQVESVGERVKAALDPIEVLLNLQPAPAKARNYRMSMDLAERHLGWLPMDSIEKQTKQIAGMLRIEPGWIERPEDRMKCRNIEWMTHLMKMQEELTKMGGVF